MNRNAIEEIKARIPIEDLIGSYVKIEKSGRALKARCPFHNEKTPSFFVSPERGGYYCFGCGAKGDIFTFVEQFEGLDFKGALKVLAEKAGVPLVMNDKNDSERDRLFGIMEETAKFYEGQFAGSPEAKEYVKGRGINPETRAAFRIGWAPGAWKNLLTYLKGKGWKEDIIEKAGLIKKSDAGDGHGPSGARGANLSAYCPNYYDRFRGRIIFPIADSSGRVVAFTGRILHDDGKSAKYLNSPETPLFNKSQILFGLDKAKSEIRRMGYSVLVEGQMDLVLSHQAGVKNVIAASGTALTDQVQGESGAVSNLGMVRRLSPNMIISLDSDKAGRTAAMRAVAATALSMGMSVKIADIEGGKDPADLILHDPESWKKVLKSSKHVVEYELGNVLRETSDSHKVARAIRDRIFPFLGRIESEMDKAFYIKEIAEKTGLAETSIWDDLRKHEKNQKNASGGQTHVPGTTPAAKGADAKKSAAGDSDGSLKNLHSDDSRDSQSHRLDLVERRIFGLLALMESAKHPDTGGYRDKIKRIAGDRYEGIVLRIDAVRSDILFEAEAFYGDEKDRWNLHMEELMFNFEEDIISLELVSAMNELRISEKEGKNEQVAKLAKKCQILSLRKAELGKFRRK